jgi:hypothetical protein
MRRGVRSAAQLLEAQGPAQGFRWRCAFVTLTYRDPEAWEPRHISQLADHVRQYLAKRGIPFLRVWVMELQRRGAPHYHLLIWLPFGVKLPKLDQRGWWPHGSTNMQWARSPVGYLMKYASKVGTATRFPKHARIFGVGGLLRHSRALHRWRMLPRYVREKVAVGERVTRLAGRWEWVDGRRYWRPGGGWLVESTGEWIPPPVLLFVDGVLWLLPPESEAAREHRCSRAELAAFRRCAEGV